MDVLIYFYLMNVVIAFEKQHTYQTEVDATRNGSTGIITSPGYPRNYPNNAAYKWTLKTGNLNATVSFNFHDFDIKKYEHTPHCEDYLQIYESKPCCFKAIHRCGKFEPFSLTVHGSVITIYFVSDNLHNTKGFNLIWTVYIPSTPAVSKTSVWTSKIQATLSAKVMCTTGPKKLGTTDPEISTSKTENNMRTSSRTPLNREKTSLMKTNTRKMLTIFSLTKSVTEGNIIISTAPASPNKLQKSLVRNDKRKMLAILMTVKYQTEGKITFPTAHSTTETLTKTDLLKTTTTLITTQQITEQNKTIETLGTKEIVYLVAGIGVVELTLVALGIYIVKQRRANTRQLDTGKPDKGKNRPVSRKSVASVGNIYESIPMEHFSIKDAVPEEDESVYTEVPEHMYDKTFEHRPRVNVNANLYQLLSELKTKNK